MKDAKYKVEIPDLEYFKWTIPCQQSCPVQTDARGYVIAAGKKQYEQGYIMSRQPNPFDSVCGRVCNAPCEKGCRRGAIDDPIQIRALKRVHTERYGVEARLRLPVAQQPGQQFADDLLWGRGPENSNTKESVFALTDLASSKGMRAVRPTKVAVIGAGPAGLSAAHDLAIMGYQVTVFEAAQSPGGMMILGVPEYRLPRDLLNAEIQAIIDRGVELRCDSRLGRDFLVRDLRQQGYEAIFIAIGAYKSRDLTIEGVELDGVLRAIDFLLNVNMGYKVDLGKRVLVIGGGNTAMDVARTAARWSEEYYTPPTMTLTTHDDMLTAFDAARQALRVGAHEVHLLCLEARDEMPADEIEVEDSLDEGVIFHNRLSPQRIVGRNGRVAALQTLDVAQVFDENRRFNPIVKPGTERVWEADSIIMAIGQACDLSWIRDEDGIQITPRGLIQTDKETMATTAPGIFAGGDVAFGPRLIIDAVGEGHKAAMSIHQYLQNEGTVLRRRGWMTVVEPQDYLVPGYLTYQSERSPLMHVERRIGITEVELSYPEEMAVEQGQRCLQCHIQTVFDGDKCIACGGCCDVCPYHCLKLVRIDEIEGEEDLDRAIRARYGRSLEDYYQAGERLDYAVLRDGAIMLKDEDRCVRCALCVLRCPTGAITMEAFEFQEDWIPADEVEEPLPQEVAGTRSGK